MKSNRATQSAARRAKMPGYTYDYPLTSEWKYCTPPEGDHHSQCHHVVEVWNTLDDASRSYHILSESGLAEDYAHAQDYIQNISDVNVMVEKFNKFIMENNNEAE